MTAQTEQIQPSLLHKYFILAADGRTPVEITDFMEWARWYNETDRKVATDRLMTFEGDGDPCGEVVVSTVFISNVGPANNQHGPPRLWETMIFGGPFAYFAASYETYDAAEEGHKKAVEMARLSRHVVFRLGLRRSMQFKVALSPGAPSGMAVALVEQPLLTQGMIEEAADFITGRQRFAAWCETHLSENPVFLDYENRVAFRRKRDAAIFAISAWPAAWKAERIE